MWRINMSEIIMEQITLEKANLIIQNSIKKAREIKIMEDLSF